MFGPVIDPHESWDFGVLRVTSEAAALALIEKDPAKTIGVYELFPFRFSSDNCGRSRGNAGAVAEASPRFTRGARALTVTGRAPKV